MALSRKDFVGALTGRAAARARAGHAGGARLRRSTSARTIFRVHDVAAAADFLAVRAALRGEVDVARELALADALRWEQPAPSSYSREATGCRRLTPTPRDAYHPHQEEHDVNTSAPPISRRARSPTFTRSPPRSASTATAVCARTIWSTRSWRARAPLRRAAARRRAAPAPRRAPPPRPRSDGPSDAEAGRRGRARTRRPEDGDARAPGRSGAGAAASRPRPRRRGRRRSRRRRRARDERAPSAERVAEGVVELLANGSGFLRVSADRGLRRRRLHLGRAGAPLRARRRATASAARCARRGAPSATRRWSASTRSTGRRPTRPSSARASTTSRSTSRRARSRSGDDAGARGDRAAAPFGRGSRVVICGPARSGRSELAAPARPRRSRPVDGLEVELLAVGVRPEELSDWKRGPECDRERPLASRPRPTPRRRRSSRRPSAAGGSRCAAATRCC